MNLRPPGPKPGAIPDYAISRYVDPIGIEPISLVLQTSALTNFAKDPYVGAVRVELTHSKCCGFTDRGGEPIANLTPKLRFVWESNLQPSD